MSLLALFASDLAAITALVFGVYFPRHRRRDLVAAFLCINVAVLGITQALSSVELSAGLGLGLFGVLSIIRLRSAEMDHTEISYFFAALALGLLGGFLVTPAFLSPLLMATVLAALAIGDHPRLLGRYRQQVVTLDRAIVDEAALHQHLEQLLGASVHEARVRSIDLVRDTTVVDVRYRLPGSASPRRRSSAQQVPLLDNAAVPAVATVPVAPAFGGEVLR